MKHKDDRNNRPAGMESNIIVDRNAPAPTDMVSEFVEETMENIQHLFDDEPHDKKENESS